MSEGRRAGTVVVGLGNPLMGDDGIGLAALEELRARWRFTPPVTLVDGGTWGLNLLPTLEDAERALMIDAIDIARDPGAVVELARDQLPRAFATKLSPHQIDLREVLALAELRGTLPETIMAVGLQPATVTMSTALSPAVAAAVPALVDRVVGVLAAWGHVPEAAA